MVKPGDSAGDANRVCLVGDVVSNQIGVIREGGGRRLARLWPLPLPFTPSRRSLVDTMHTVFTSRANTCQSGTRNHRRRSVLYSERSTKTKRSAFSGTNEPSIIIGIDRANKELEKRESQTALEHQDDSTDSKALLTSV